MKLVVPDSTRTLIVALLLFLAISVGCKSKVPHPESNSQSTSQGAPQNPQQIGLDDLVAPIALYPDQLLAQVLTTAVNPQEVLDLGNWLLQNQHLEGDALTNAAKQAGFSPSAQYLALFPQVVDNMCQQMDWTRQLGEAFKSDQGAVMDAVQRKRAQAEKIGNLNSGPQMKVENKTADNGQSYVAIEPADPKVVYVPQYNPVTIYNSPAPAAPTQATTTTTTAKEEDGVSNGEAAAIGLLSFGIGMAVGSAINNDYYPYPAWGYHGVYVAGRPYYPAAYRAPVYAGYRPAYGYRPPGNYRWNQYNRNINATINNNYYNRFNARSANNRQTYTGQNRSYSSAQNPNWKGQTTYQGTRKTSAGQRPGASMANAVPRTQQYGQRNTQLATNRRYSGTIDSSSSRTVMSRPSTSDAAAHRQVQPGSNRGGDRGYGTSYSATRSANSASASNRSTSPSSRPENTRAGGVFSGDSGSGRQERMASNRGRASMGARSSGARRR
jgi:Protein of unknown function (DUF3300)